jgi:hypothetical protein
MAMEQFESPPAETGQAENSQWIQSTPKRYRMHGDMLPVECRKEWPIRWNSKGDPHAGRVEPTGQLKQVCHASTGLGVVEEVKDTYRFGHGRPSLIRPEARR